MRPLGARIGALLVLVALLAACGDDGPDVASEGTATSSTTTTAPTTTTTTTTTSTTSSTIEPPSDDTCSGGQSSPSTFDAAGGRYAVSLTSLDVAGRTIGFDVIQFLWGDDAIDAYHEDFPEDPEGPPNDYYTVNDNPLVREAPVAPEVRVQLVRLQEDGDADLDPGSFAELPTYLADHQAEGSPLLSYNPYWLTFIDGTVTEICEQYIP